MIIVRADTRHATCTSDDAITTGSVGIQVKFMLSGQFNGLSAVAVFRSTGASVDVALMSNTCVVPPEVLRASGAPLYIGVYARNSAGTVVIPTVWTATKDIQRGTRPSGVNPSEPTPDWTAQVQLAAQEAVQTSEQAIENSERAIEIAGGAQAAADDARQSADEAAQSATAAAASEAAAREVEESIPADYTELSEDVSDLKSATNNAFNISMSGAGTFDPVNFGSWVRGYVDGTTGNVSSLDRRICQSNPDSQPFPLHITIKSGFQINVTYFSGSSVSRTDYSITGKYTIPENSSYKITIRRVTEDASEVADFAEFLGALAITSPYVETVEGEIQDLSDDFDKIIEFSDNPYLITDWSTISLDSYLNNNGSISTSANNWTSDFIPVEANTQYAMSVNANQNAVYLGNVVFFNANKVSISAVQNVATFTTPANTAYVRMCRQYYSASGTGSAAGINSSNYLTADYIINKSNLQKGSAGSVLENTYLKKDIRIETWFKGKKVLSYGDSIVELNKWQPYCKQYFGTDTFWNGGGVGGTTVYNNGGQVTFPGTSTPVDSWMCSDGRINRIKSIYPNADCIIVLAGHNDWSESCPIGEIGDTLVDSNFKSAYALMLKKLVEGFPNSRIICCTPINGRVQTAGVNQDVQMKNQLGLCITDYANAVIDVCRHYGIPCIDLNGETGISVLNAATYIGDVVHPNAAGGKLIANAVINGMTRFNPIAF